MLRFQKKKEREREKRYRVADWIQNKTLQYAAYKRFISGLKTYINWKLRDGKNTSCKWEW